MGGSVNAELAEDKLRIVLELETEKPYKIEKN